MGLSYSYEEAADLIEGLTQELDSHLTASILGWKYAASRQEIYAAGTFARVVNATRGKGDKPIQIDLPWDTEPKAADVTPEERQALTKQLRAMSAFGQLRTETPDG
ncbi:hypothetical protein NG701_17160 [Pseudarthrobacter sp. HLT3-5]|uniref:hypothetical protein n=1 Tax=Pseudarthrobacter cellobiosi TaxID=2953654 RepID=UPI00208EBEEF|nr:hypothetical protein [Pseudarthrobacter sp. HLT3-5]MCO4276132.1 hypothetical protein [Pseudarthrobacter sp. HLT3-5]